MPRPGAVVVRESGRRRRASPVRPVTSFNAVRRHGNPWDGFNVVYGCIPWSLDVSLASLVRFVRRSVVVRFVRASVL
mgnify:CR=1 FL=1